MLIFLVGIEFEVVEYLGQLGSDNAKVLGWFSAAEKLLREGYNI